MVVVHAPDVLQDRDRAKLLLECLWHRFSQRQLIWGDGGYAGNLVGWVGELRKANRLRLEIVVK
jgi:hypothetical protein